MVSAGLQLFTALFPMAAAATLMAGYSYMEERERRQENALLKALEEMNRALIEETNRWEERHLSQERKIKDILHMEKRLENVEAEQRRVRRERNQWKKDEGLLFLEPLRGNDISSMTFLTANDVKPEKMRTEFLTADVKPGKKRTEFLTADVKPEKKQTEVKPEKKRTEFLVAEVKPETKQTEPTLSTNLCKLTLDPNTAHKNLYLTENDTKATRVMDIHTYPYRAERFDYWEQVLCREGLTGRCYFEVEWSGRVSIAMAYKTINRRGVDFDCAFGYNDKSWSLECYKRGHYKRCSVRHNRKTHELPVGHSATNRIGVYLDSAAGNLSFYSISSDTWTHLYTYQTEFTERLYPGFMFGHDSSVSLYQIESI